MHIQSKGYPKSESEMEEQFSLGEYRAYDNTVTQPSDYDQHLSGLLDQTVTFSRGPNNESKF